MTPDLSHASTTGFAELERQHPQITRHFGRVFDDTTTSYKLFWFRALLETLKRRWMSEPNEQHQPIAVGSLLSEMVVAAWHPVCLFHLSLGTTDKLQEICVAIRKLSGLAPNAQSQEIRGFLNATPELEKTLSHLTAYVPALFLTPWFATELRGINGGTTRVKEATRLAFERHASSNPSPYWLDARGTNRMLHLDLGWEEFLKENLAVMEGFADHHLARYLQARNPNSPAIMNKLRAPFNRQLNQARAFWLLVHDALNAGGKLDSFQDIYAAVALGRDFSIDHFLPWSYVAHDQLWNLVPVLAETNSRKSDNLPDAELYLPRLARLHYKALSALRDKPRFHEDYVICFKQNLSSILDKGEDQLVASYRTVFVPQLQIAQNQGFEAGWRLEG